MLMNHESLVVNRWTLVPNDDGVSYSVDEAEAFLEHALEQGFVCHGSPTLIHDSLQPRLTGDRDNSRPAVYLTDVPVLALFCAIAGRSGWTQRTTEISCTTSNGVRTYHNVRLVLESRAASDLQSHGYVYLVPRDKALRETEHELLSYEAVLPMLVLRVSRADLRFDVTHVLRTR
jgi:hypothetical protein